MKRLKDLSIGILIGALLFNSPAIANTIKTLIAEEATFPLVLDGNEIKLNNPIITIEGRTYLPLKEFGDILGVNVKWNTEKDRVEISKGEIIMTTNEHPYVTIEGNEYINIRDVDNICADKRYSLSWQGGLHKTQWYTLQSLVDSTISFEGLLDRLGITEGEANGLTREELKIKHGFTIYSKTIRLFPEQNEFPYMTREEFENVVLPFINKN